jgi:hypothetical protein
MNICRFDSTLDLRSKHLTYTHIKQRVLDKSMFSIFEATATKRHEALFTQLCRDPELVIDEPPLGYPWVRVRHKDNNNAKKEDL